MPIRDALQSMRGQGPQAPWMQEQGLQQPAIDPIQMITGLLGPSILKSLLSRGAVGGMLEQAAPEGFAQADMMLARLRAQAQKQAGMMRSEQLAKMTGIPGARPMLGGRGGDFADIGFKIPEESMTPGVPNSLMRTILGKFRGEN